MNEVSTFYIRLEKSEYYDPIHSRDYRRDQNTPEVKEQEEKDKKNLMKYEVFEKVEDC